MVLLHGQPAGVHDRGGALRSLFARQARALERRITPSAPNPPYALASPRCGAKTRAGGARQKALPHARGAPGSGAPRGNQNARRHGLFTGEVIAERKQIQALLGEARKLLHGMK